MAVDPKQAIKMGTPARGDPAVARRFEQILPCEFGGFSITFLHILEDTNMTYGHINRLPTLPPMAHAAPCPWQPGLALQDWIAPRVLELTYTAWDLAPFTQDRGYAGSPFLWDDERRFPLRCELDAVKSHPCGTAREDVEYIIGTFPIVLRKDEAAYGEYRTQRVIVEIYDAVAEAQRTGQGYRTRLDPPPADPRVAHGWETKPVWAE